MRCRTDGVAGRQARQRFRYGQLRMTRIPRRSYLLRAMMDWIIDSGHTPYVLVDATYPGVQVPAEHVQDGRIVLNLSASAVRGLGITRDALSCDGRFSGRAFGIVLPMGSIAAVYARETGEGMVFEAEEFTVPGPGADPSPLGGNGTGSNGGAPSPKGSHLKRIK